MEVTITEQLHTDQHNLSENGAAFSHHPYRGRWRQFNNADSTSSFLPNNRNTQALLLFVIIEAKLLGFEQVSLLQHMTLVQLIHVQYM